MSKMWTIIMTQIIAGVLEMVAMTTDMAYVVWVYYNQNNYHS